MANHRATVGVLIDPLAGGYETLLRRGLLDLARARGFGVRFFVGRSMGSPHREDEAHNRIYALARPGGGERVDGLVVTAPSLGHDLPPEAVDRILASYAPLPVVTLGLKARGYDGVVGDNVTGISELVAHLVQVHGRRRLAFLAGPLHSIDAAGRRLAFGAALRAAGLPRDPRLVLQGDFTNRSGERVAAALDLRDGLPFDAVVAANDNMALGLMEALDRRGFHCPRDYALTGFDDIADARLCSPGLTTVHQPIYQQAMLAGERLLARLAGRPGPAQQGAEAADGPLRCGVVLRQSCGCTGPRAGAGEVADAGGPREALRDARELITLRTELQALRGLWSRLADTSDLVGLVGALGEAAPLVGLRRLELHLHAAPEPPGGDPLGAPLTRHVCAGPGDGEGSEQILLPLVTRQEVHGYALLESGSADAAVLDRVQELVAERLDALHLAAGRTRALRQLQASEERSLELAEMVSLLVVETDPGLRILHLDPAARQALGIDDQIGAIELWAHLEPADVPAARERLRDLPRLRTFAFPGLRLVHRGGDRLLPVVQLAALLDGEGALRRVRWIALDPVLHLASGLRPEAAFYEAHRIEGQEREICELLLDGLRPAELPERLDLDEEAVNAHLDRLEEKLAARGRLELLRRIQEEELRRLEPDAYLAAVARHLFRRA